MSRDKRQEEKPNQPAALITTIGLITAALIALIIWGRPPQAPAPTPIVKPKPQPKLLPASTPKPTPEPAQVLPPEKLDPIAIKGLEARVSKPTRTPERRARELPRELPWELQF